MTDVPSGGRPPGAPAPAAANKEVFRRFVRYWNSGDFAAMAACWAPEMVHHGRAGTMGPDRVAALMTEFTTAFRDLRFEIEDLVAEGDMVAARMRVTATHAGEFRGLAPTGRRIEVMVMGQVRMAGGRITEHWNVMDELHFMQQLGLAPAGLLDPAPA